MVQKEPLSSACGSLAVSHHCAPVQTSSDRSISQKCNCRKWEKRSIRVRNYEKERRTTKDLLKGTGGCGAPHSFSNGPSTEGRRMKQGVLSAKVDTCLLYWCPAYAWIARGAQTNVPSLHSSRKWSLRLHSLCLWVTCWETQARVSAWPYTAWYCRVAGLQNLSRPTGDCSTCSHWNSGWVLLLGRGSTYQPLHESHFGSSL